jgi:serine/threonine-protein kinase
MAVERQFLNGAFQVVSRMVAASDAPPKLPRYAVGERLGEGAMAVVYRGLDRTLGRPVAIKVLRESLASNEDGRDRFIGEARTLAGLSHPNVVAVHDAGEHEGVPFIVMELVDGRPLSRVLRERDLPMESLLALLEKAARGAAAAHERGIAHRDLKPGNILVAASGEPKVADFGLARAVESAGGLTLPGTMLGTPLYMAPEQVRAGPRRVGPWTDVYALGAILYEILTGSPPNTAESLGEIYRRIVEEEPVPPKAVEAGVPADLQTLCLKALERNPERRYPTAREFADDLGRYLAGEPILARPPGVARRVGLWVRRHRAWAAAAAAATVTAAVFAAFAVRDTDSNVARELLMQKRRNVEEASRQWKREARDNSSLETLLRQADERIGQGKLDEAAALLDRALARIGLHQRLGEIRLMAQLWELQGRDAAALRSIADEAELRIREEKPEDAAALINRAATLAAPADIEPIHLKMQAVQRGIQSWTRQGRDPSPVVRLMESFPPLVQQGKKAEAEAVLDRALGLLQERPKTQDP